METFFLEKKKNFIGKKFTKYKRHILGNDQTIKHDCPKVKTFPYTKVVLIQEQKKINDGNPPYTKIKQQNIKY